MPLCLLPLEIVVFILQKTDRSAGIRATSKELKDLYDSCNTQLLLKRTDVTNNATVLHNLLQSTPCLRHIDFGYSSATLLDLKDVMSRLQHLVIANVANLDMSYCKRLKDISSLASCTALKNLDMHYCRANLFWDTCSLPYSVKLTFSFLFFEYFFFIFFTRMLRP